MMKRSTLFLLGIVLTICTQAYSQSIPEILYYKFDGTGIKVPNYASAPPAGTDTATIMGAVTQGPTGLCGGALIGSGNSASTDYLNTGYAPNVTGSWTISIYSSDITSSSTLFYIFGDANSSSFRCFTNGVAGPNNWILRGPITDVLVNGGATVAPHVTTFVYDQTAGNIQGYLDGVLVTTVAQASAAIIGVGPFKVMGYATNVGAPAGGKLDEFRWYNRALTPAEVLELLNPYTSSTISPNSCGDYLSPAGHTYTTSGTYTDTIPNMEGCDSIITINLSVYTASTSTFSQVACDQYTAPSGAIFTSSGSYMDTIANSHGCDSVMTINLTVNHSSSSTINPLACSGSYTAPSGAVFSSTGTYMDTIANFTGCDSVITINLTIGTPSTGSITATTCNSSYTAPSGAVFSSTGTYTDTIANYIGCDSVITLNLTFHTASTSSISPMVCNSNFTAPSGAIYSASGTYTDTIANVQGCDSIITIHLTVNTVSAGATQTGSNGENLQATPASASYQWINCSGNTPVAGATSQNFTATANGMYAVIVTQNSCSDTSACFTVAGLGISSEQLKNQVKMYPNPTKGQVTIDLGTALDHFTVEVLNNVGQVLQNREISDADKIVLEVQDAPGIYFIKITQDNGEKTTLRLIKQ